jgi:hypothetical protein
MLDDQLRPGDRVALIDPSTGKVTFKGIVRKPPKEPRSILRAALHTYVKFDGISTPDWIRTRSLRILEKKVQKPLNKHLGTIKIKLVTPIFLAPKR